MPYYLTYEEFNDFSNKEIDSLAFENLLKKASAILDNVTNHFYQKTDINQDNEWRVRQFKQALCAQIEYFHELGATTFESINKAPQSFSAGRTTVNNGNSVSDREKPLISEDVYIYLEGTGLLYSGIGVV